MSSEKRCILLVEDNNEARDLFALVLEHIGAEVIRAENGVQALESLKDHTPDIVVTDIAMPRMDGIEMTRRLRESPETARVPIVAVTAHATGPELERVLQAGCNEVLPKPCLPDDLTAAVEHWVGGRRHTLRRGTTNQPVLFDRRVADRRRHQGL